MFVACLKQSRRYERCVFYRSTGSFHASLDLGSL
jgi:hypothetical protein